MSEMAHRFCLSLIFLLLVGFCETFLSTKFRQLEYKAKVLDKKVRNISVNVNTLENEIDHTFKTDLLLTQPTFKHFKEALPNDIPVVKFQHQRLKEVNRFAKQ